MTDAINFDRIGITNDVMFGSVFRDEEACRELLQRILHLEIAELTLVEEQKTLNITLTGKGSRLDIYARDVSGNSYDIEMQLTNSRELDLRSRYYHSEMDGYQIRKGKKYRALKQSIVIFICGFDLFGENRSFYTFETICRENSSLILQDKRKTVFVNIHGDREGLDEATVNLLDYFRTQEPIDAYTQGLQERVDRIRRDTEWRENYMTIEMKMDLRFEEGLAEGERIGRLEGEKNGRLEGEKIGRIEGEKNGRLEGEKIGRLGILSTMLASGMEKETILKAGFTEEEIESLKKGRDISL